MKRINCLSSLSLVENEERALQAGEGSGYLIIKDKEKGRSKVGKQCGGEIKMYKPIESFGKLRDSVCA